MLPATTTETVFATDKLALTITRPITAEQEARYAAYLADKARCEAANAKAEKDHAAALLVWLGARPAAIAYVENSRSSLFELTVTIIGKTAQAVDAKALAYAAEHDGKLPRFPAATPWHDGFRSIGTRQESI